MRRTIVRLAVAAVAVVAPLAFAPAANADCIVILFMPYC